MSEDFVDNSYRGEDKDIRNLVDWENPPSLYDLKKDLSDAKSLHNSYVSKVNNWIDVLRGNLGKKVKIAEGRSKVQPKLVRKQNEWRYAALEEPFLSAQDLFKVEPVTYKDVDAAKQNQLVLNKQFRVDINRTKFINKYVRTAVNTGTAIVKLSWETKTGIVTEEMPIYAQSLDDALAFLQNQVMMGQMSEDQAHQMLQSGQPIIIGMQPVEVEKEIVNRPVLQVRDSRNVIIDPSCEGCIDNAQFIVDMYLSDLSTLKKDGRYKNLDKIEERSYSIYNEDYYYESNSKIDPMFSFNDKPRRKLLVYEYWGYWDIHGDDITVPIVATWVGDTMIRLEENPFPDQKLPFVVVQYLPPDNDSVYGDADAALLEDNQNIIGAITRSIIDLIGRSANAQQGVRKDLLDAINRDRFSKGLDFEFNPVANLQDAMYMTKLPEIPRSALELIQLQNNEAEAISGVKAFSGGISSQALGNSATGIRSALDAVSKRELGILRRLSDGLEEIGKKIISMNSTWLPDEEIIRITDDDFVTIKRDDLAGNFDLSIKVSTAESDNQKAEELAYMLQTVGNSLPFEMTKLLLIKIADLRKLPDLAKMISDYVPQPDPLAQEAAQLQNDMLKAQIFNEQAKGKENEVDVQLKSARTQNELAKAKLSNSVADKNDLDYVEQATGLQQSRQLEQQLLGLQYKDRINREARSHTEPGMNN